MGFFSFTQELSMDLGTANTIIISDDKIAVDEPSVVALDSQTNKMIAVGERAKLMYEKNHNKIRVVRPLRDGVIADFNACEQMMRGLIKMVNTGHHLFSPTLRMVIGVPSGSTEVELRAVRDSAEHAGGRDVYLIFEPMAAAVGIGIDVEAPEGNMIVDIGGGTTEIAVISLGGIVTSASLRVAGDKFDEDITAFVKKEFNIMIGERTAEEIKMRVGAAFAGARNEIMDVRGRDMLSGLPKNVQITTAQAAEATHDSVTKIVNCVKKVLEDTPPELSADVMNCGIVLTGGGAMLYGLDELIRRETDIPTALAEDAMSCVAIGCGMALDSFNKFDGKARNVKTGR